MICFLAIAAIAQTKGGTNPGMASVLKSAATGQDPQFARLFPHPTNKNGCEEYVKATDLLEEGSASNYDNWLYGLKGHQIDTPPPPGVSRTDTYPTVQQKYVAHFKKVLVLVEEGNQKPFHTFIKEESTSVEGKSLSLASDFPVMASFRQLAKFQAQAADAEFAQNHPDKAVQILINGLPFSERIGKGSMIAYLVGYAAQAIIHAEFSRRDQRVTERGSRLLANATLAQIRKLPDAVDALQSEKRDDILSAHTYLTGPDSISRNPSAVKELDFPDAAVRELKSLSPTQITQLQARLDKTIAATMDTAINTLKGPESGWLKYEIPSVKKSALESSLLGLINLSIVKRTIQLAATNRTRQHLIYLDSKVNEYRLTHGHLPTALTDCVSKPETTDQICGGTYLYQPQNGWFVLQSKGFGINKPIDLKPKRL